MKYFKSLLLLISFALFSSDLLANDGQLISGMSNMSVLIGIVAFMSLFLILAFLTLGVTFNGFLSKNQDSDEEEEPSAFGVWFWSKFNQATPIEKEKDIMLDHNYDGIRELDNQLPAWWKYLFWGSVIMSPIYLYYYSGSTPISIKEYKAEMEIAKIQKRTSNKGKKSLDEKNLTVLEDGISLANGKSIYAENCASCHAPEAQGLVGPNLTDEYWLHGGSVPEVYKVVKEGVAGTAMLAWKDKMSAKQMHEAVSYIMSLQGSNPANPRKPEGTKNGETPSTDDKTTAVEEEATTEDVAGAGIDGKAIFAAKCLACHGAEAQGMVGPNLTDEFWKNGGSLEEIVKTIDEGITGTAMMAFAPMLKEGESKALAEFIISLEGSNPDGAKAAEGEKYVR